MGEGLRDRTTPQDEVAAWMAAHPEASEDLIGRKTPEKVVADAAKAKAKAARIAEKGIGTNEVPEELSADPMARQAE